MPSWATLPAFYRDSKRGTSVDTFSGLSDGMVFEAFSSRQPDCLVGHGSTPAGSKSPDSPFWGSGQRPSVKLQD
jgi:hypothetical protein